ncbi:GGDEF domain-containing response regulator [Methylobacterium haplocladii]|uniref:diguanylate cyclase n=1 Tax=Methylobacterium haplocladii TaxID=1176176 RepID=A0A512IR41_9HYPH|nr:diguanylate cyclase [Methylobacterium haplocladii]GEP00187.1 diguanylate cyclase response regulator [Methylobacterium haplocladii]GJD83758.1 Response regulator PleD [Methylobacterium haplocladii]GLS57967.1 diguanylate cyclase response regulator [Methylobacterium haplocladii]
MHIAIVDSSRVVLKLVAGLLEPRGHVIEPFTDSAQALDYISAHPSITALITSLEVRPISGLELCWAARLLGDASRPLSIIVMSSSRSTHTLAEALDSGADDFIEKPPSAEELHARLRAAERLNTMQSALIRLAETDPLTGLTNRRAFMRRAHEAVADAGAGGSLAAILVDIDHFKRINDAHGHDVGDEAIKAVASLISGNGIAGRLGGEEFALLLPDRDIARALVVAERLRRRVVALRIPAEGGPVKLSCSFGVSAWRSGETVDGLLKRADIALYEAKSTGRDRVVSAREERPLSKAC